MTVHDDQGRPVDLCSTCTTPIRYSGDVDPTVPWVHVASGNLWCDVTVPEDAVMFAGAPGRPTATPTVHPLLTPGQAEDVIGLLETVDPDGDLRGP